MRILKGAMPVAVALAVVAVVTAVLWLIKLDAVGPQHLVFFYLLPTAFVAILYGSLPAMLCAVLATACAAFFLYDPLYSFHVTNSLELGELVCFTGLALIGAKCTAELLRPVTNFPTQNSVARDQNWDAS
jgi:K+-sensing histidine kinase KdpD